MFKFFTHCKKIKDDKKSSIGNSECKDEGRLDSFDSEEMDQAINPGNNRAAYAKSNFVKGKLGLEKIIIK